jgi:hypothetical protein
MRQDTDRKVLICLPSDEAFALVQLGAALEPFMQRGSPADLATCKMDEQTAQQSRGRDHLVECVAEELGQRLEMFLPSHVTEVDLVHAAEGAVDQVLGYYDEEG